MNFFKSLKNLISFFKIAKSKREIVFYAENENSYLFFQGLIKKLISEYKLDIHYVTSSISDPILRSNNKNFKTYFIGSETIKTIYFKMFDSKIMILTMPELNIYHLKRSSHDVKYIFIPHNILSLHMTYKRKAFNYYDIIFCSGPHHNREIMELSKVYNINSIKSFNYGYYKIDKLGFNFTKNRNKTKNILIAPSWGENGIIEKYGTEIIDKIIDSEFNIIVRPHPETLIRSKKVYNRLKNKYRKKINISFEENITNMNSFYFSDIMISDWSGAAFEFSFGLEKPVIFIDTPKKINNVDYNLFKSVPFEMEIRSKIGKLVYLDEIKNLKSIINSTYNNMDQFVKNIIKLRKKELYNFKDSSSIGSKYIYDLLN